MILIRLILVAGLFLPIPLVAQTVTAKLNINPIHIKEYLPLSAGAAIEVGVSKKSSLQMSGLYRIDKQISVGIDHGPKLYLDYRYYLHPVHQQNSGLYVSPFVGYGTRRLAYYLDQVSETATQRTNEAMTGVLFGYQPYRRSRFSVDIHAGPEYQWRMQRTSSASSRLVQSSLNRVWFRAGLSLCVRLRK